MIGYRKKIVNVIKSISHAWESFVGGLESNKIVRQLRNFDYKTLIFFLSYILLIYGIFTAIYNIYVGVSWIGISSQNVLNLLYYLLYIFVAIFTLYKKDNVILLVLSLLLIQFII